MNRLTLTLAGSAAAAACFLGAGTASAVTHVTPEKFPSSAKLADNKVTVVLTNNSPVTVQCSVTVAPAKDLAEWQKFRTVTHEYYQGKRAESEYNAVADATIRLRQYGQALGGRIESGRSGTGSWVNPNPAENQFTIIQLCVGPVNGPAPIVNSLDDLPTGTDSHLGINVYEVGASGGGTDNGGGSGSLGDLDLFGSLG